MKIFQISIISVFILILIGCSRTASEPSLRAFREAQSAFEKAEKLPQEEQVQEFHRVASLFQNIILQGVKSDAVYYNLGNSWLRAGEPGQALAAYHLAQRFSPLDPYIASNMQTALGQASPLPPTTPILEYLFFWQNWIGCQTKARLSLILVVLTFLSGTILLFYRQRFLKRLSLLLIALTLIATASAGYDWYRFELQRHAVIAAETAIPRKGNSEQYEPVFTSPVSLGTVAIVLDERTDWLRLRFSSDQDGWLPKNQVVIY